MQTLTKYEDVDLCGLGSADVPDGEDILAGVVPVTELDDGHGPGWSVLEVVFLTQIQIPVSLGPGGLGVGPATYSGVQNQVRTSSDGHGIG